MANIRIVSVEDDPIYAETIQMIVEQAGYELTGQFSNGEEALLAIKAIKPDLLLLDIHIAGSLTGIELAERVAAHTPVIFITSLREREVFEKAKSTRPVAFILKPFDSLMLQNTIDLAISQFAGEAKNVLTERDIIVKDSFFIKEKSSLIKVPITSIVYIEAEDKYCTLCTSDKKFVIRISLNDLLTKLPDTFVRTHRSVVVDATKITQLNLDRQELQLGSVVLPIGTTYKEALLTRLKKIG
ncbi:MAG: response regulator [Cyclobacteriaceae bacterium]|nr:response regulator [Cyclobacteriaceae bacterium]